MTQNYLEISALKYSLVLAATLLVSGCSNISPLTKTNVANNQTMQALPTKVTPSSIAAVKPAAFVIDWQKIEMLADNFYKNTYPYSANLQSHSDFTKSTPSRISPVEKWYAKSFGVSVEEARKRLILQSSSRGVIEAIEKVLGEAFVEAYYINDYPDEFRLGVTTTHAIKASSYVYTFKDGLKGLALPIYIYPISDKTKAQIDQQLEKATSEIFKRYPDTQSMGFDPITNTIVVSIYRKTTDEAERQRIEAELTELVGHRVAVEFMKNRITTL